MNDKKIEEWKRISGYEDIYEVSSFGRVRNVLRNNNILKGGSYPNLYNFVCLSKNKIKANLMIHRLVAIAFIPNPNNKPQVNHKDGNKRNNNVSNLEWVTCSENLKHAVDIGTVINQCKICRKAVISYEDGKNIEFDTLKNLALYFGYKRGWAFNRMRKYGNIFYEQNAMITIEERNH